MVSQPAPPAGANRESTVSMGVVRGLVDIAVLSGVPRTRFLRAAQLEPTTLDAPDARMSRAEVYRLCELAMELTENPALGLHWGERLTGTTFPPISALIAHAATLRQGLNALYQFHRLLTDDFTYEMHESHDRVIIRCSGLPDEALRVKRFVAEMFVTGMVRLIRSFSVDARLSRVNFEYAAPAYRAEYERIFEGAQRFEQPFTGVVFDRRLLSAASPVRDEDVHGALRSIAERRVLRIAERVPYAVRVRELLTQQAAACRGEMKTVAAAFGLSVRSLRRRLAAEGTSYAAVADDALASIAKTLLRDKQRTIQEAAYEMGFSDTSTFHRAFKRWTGTTPRAFRNER
jgi:AraC-like DNA-binding protein